MNLKLFRRTTEKYAFSNGQRLRMSECHSMRLKNKRTQCLLLTGLTFVSVIGCLVLARVTDCRAKQPSHISPDVR